MNKLLRHLSVFMVLATLVLGGALGVGVACSDDSTLTPDLAQQKDSRAKDGKTVWEDGSPADSTRTDVWHDMPSSGAQ